MLSRIGFWPGRGRPPAPPAPGYPAAAAEEFAEARRPDGSHTLGMVATITPAPSPVAWREELRRPVQPHPSATPAAAPVVATPAALPLPSVPPAQHRHGHSQPPKHHDTD